jgi:tRNA nucleotidyltransferase (CCA-adding enzyme)
VDEWVVYFLALMDAIPESAVREVLARLNLSARHAAIVRTGRFQSAELLRRLARPRVKPSDIHRWLAPLPDEVLLFLMAKTASQTAKRAISTFVTTGRTVKPALTGKDLHALGVKPGPIYRTILDALLKARLNGEVASEQDERKLVERLLARRPPSR